MNEPGWFQTGLQRILSSWQQTALNLEVTDMNTALVIMAAGLGSRYEGGIKQITPVGPSGEIIIDYSVHDALKAGFNRIIFVIRKDIEKDFREAIGSRMEKLAGQVGAEICYAYQALDDIPGSVPAGRTKPWGTGQAVLAAKAWLDLPYMVINADDYYGVDAFSTVHEFLVHNHDDQAVAGFILKNTLSANGGVTRGIIKVDPEGFVTDIAETKDIRQEGDLAVAAGGQILPLDAHVSMNMWGFQPAYTALLEKGFADFLDHMKDPMTDEFLLPIFTNDLIHEDKVKVRVLESHDRWFGITYKEDLPQVLKDFRTLYDQGVYSQDLYSDIKHQ